MRLDRVLFTGSVSPSHPLLDRMFGGSLRPMEAGDPASYDLVVVDGQQGGGHLAEGGTAHRALAAGVAVLVVAPNEDQCSDLTKIVGSGPVIPVQAVFVTPSRNEGEARRRYDVRALGFVTDRHILGGSWGMNDAIPDGARKRVRASAKAGDVALTEYIAHIERRVEQGFRPVALAEMPAGLKWSFSTWDYVMGFTYATGGDDPFTNGAGSLTFTMDFRTFLSQTETLTQTYVVMQGSYALNPGGLAEDGPEGRCVMNMWMSSGVKPEPAGFAIVDHIPTSGDNSWSGDFTVRIFYAMPTGGTGEYEYPVSVKQDISGWSVQESSDGTQLGSRWYVNTPVNGITFPEENRRGAYNGAGHIEPFPSACTTTVTLQDASAWRVDGEYTGRLWLACDFEAKGDSVYATGCALGLCFAWGVAWDYVSFFPRIGIDIAWV